MKYNDMEGIRITFYLYLSDAQWLKNELMRSREIIGWRALVKYLSDFHWLIIIRFSLAE